MSKQVTAVANLELVAGTSKIIKVKNGEVAKLPNEIPKNVIFVLNAVSVTQGDLEIALGAEQDGKRFVPSFELAKSSEEFIVNYFAEATEDQQAIKLRGLVNITTGDISITGEGFEEAEVEMVEYKEPDSLAKEIKDGN